MDIEIISSILGDTIILSLILENEEKYTKEDFKDITMTLREQPNLNGKLVYQTKEMELNENILKIMIPAEATKNLSSGVYYGDIQFTFPDGFVQTKRFQIDLQWHVSE